MSPFSPVTETVDSGGVIMMRPDMAAMKKFKSLRDLAPESPTMILLSDTATLIVDMFKLSMATMLSIFVPQLCDGSLDAYVQKDANTIVGAYISPAVASFQVRSDGCSNQAASHECTFQENFLCLSSFNQFVLAWNFVSLFCTRTRDTSLACTPPMQRQQDACIRCSHSLTFVPLLLFSVLVFQYFLVWRREHFLIESESTKDTARRCDASRADAMLTRSSASLLLLLILSLPGTFTRLSPSVAFTSVTSSPTIPRFRFVCASSTRGSSMSPSSPSSCSWST